MNKVTLEMSVTLVILVRWDLSSSVKVLRETKERLVDKEILANKENKVQEVRLENLVNSVCF